MLSRMEAMEEAKKYFNRNENDSVNFDIHQKSLVYDFIDELYAGGFRIIQMETGD